MPPGISIRPQEQIILRGSPFNNQIQIPTFEIGLKLQLFLSARVHTREQPLPIITFNSKLFQLFLQFKWNFITFYPVFDIIAMIGQ